MKAKDYLSALAYIQLALQECENRGWKLSRQNVRLEKLALQYGGRGTKAAKKAIPIVWKQLQPLFNIK